MLETILGILITTALAAIALILGKLWPTLRALVPKWVIALVDALAYDFVRWVDTEYASAPGVKRFEIVFDMLEEKLRALRIEIDTDILQAAIEAAWFQMNAEQVSVGLKEIEVDVHAQ